MPRVLLIEDNEVNRDLLLRRLRQNGFEMLSAENGEQGLALVREQLPDLVLTDLGLPDIDGREIIRRLKADPKTATIPIIAVSAHVLGSAKEASLQLGCDDYETKPVKMPSLLEKMRSLLATKGVAANVPVEKPVVEKKAAVAENPEPKKPPEPTAPPANVKHILVVEDNDANREMLARRLRKQGFEVSEAPNGKHALQLTRQNRYDLVLLDIMMPEVDGYEVLSTLKADPDTAPLPVIMISALDDMPSIVRCIEMGAEDYLTKPFDPVLLNARITACLDKRRLRDQELAYFKAVTALTSAAAMVEQGQYEPSCLSAVSAREDELGRLARLFERMAHEVIAREVRLKQQVEQLKVEIDEARKREQVAEITETTYFQDLQRKVGELRRRTRRAGSTEPPTP